LQFPPCQRQFSSDNIILPRRFELPYTQLSIEVCSETHDSFERPECLPYFEGGIRFHATLYFGEIARLYPFFDAGED
jgi:hypothetical protein